MARVKSLKLSQPDAERAARIGAIRRHLGYPRRPFTQPELHKELVSRYGVDAPSLRTVKRWEQTGRISPDDAAILADLARCSIDWLLRGIGTPEWPDLALGSPPAAQSEAGAPLAPVPKLSPKEREMVRTAVLRYVNQLVEEVPLSDLIELFEREERWLKRRKYFRAAEETALLRAQLITISQELRKRGTK